MEPYLWLQNDNFKISLHSQITGMGMSEVEDWVLANKVPSGGTMMAWRWLITQETEHCRLLSLSFIKRSWSVWKITIWPSLKLQALGLHFTWYTSHRRGLRRKQQDTVAQIYQVVSDPWGGGDSIQTVLSVIFGPAMHLTQVFIQQHICRMAKKMAFSTSNKNVLGL